MNAKNTQRSLLLPILGAVAIIAALGTGGYFWWSRNPQPKVDDKKPPIVQNPGKKNNGNGNGNVNDKNGSAKKDNRPTLPDAMPVSFSAAMEFLHAGPDAVQIGLDPLALDAKRTATLRGLVYKDEKQPFEGVNISIQNQPSYGKTHSKDDGTFNMCVNGGSLMTVGFTREGYLPVWRQAAAPWQDYAWLPPVVMTTIDAKVTPVKTGSKDIQIARGSKVKDKDGERQAMLVFQSGTKAVMAIGGKKVPLDTMNVRATEYTAGDKGPDRMPAPLPANSAFTYCVELSVDEAIAAGAKSVHFDKAVVHYVENFLNFPVGIPVPLGYFDPDKGAWVASESGRIVKIVAINKGMADLDVNGKDKPADAKELAALKVTNEERQELAKTYKVGTSLWRVAIPHFSIWDLNWGFSPPRDAVPPRQPPPTPTPDAPPPRREKVLAFLWMMNHDSDRMPGAKGPRTVRIPVSGKDLPKSVKQIVIEIYIAGQRIEVTLPAQPDQFYVFTWDGKDVFGRPLVGAQNVRVRIGYVYDGVYEQTAVFGSNGNGEIITGSRTRQEVTLWQEHEVTLGFFDARVFGLGGWSFDMQHAYDPAGRILYLGNGERHAANTGGAIGNLTISTVAGGGKQKALGDGGPALDARLDNPKAGDGAGTKLRRTSISPRGLAVAPDGTLFVTDANNRVRRIDNDGTITTIAGGGKEHSGKATEIYLQEPGAIALGPDGSLFIVENDYSHRILRLDLKSGALTPIAGGNGQGFEGDGGAALKARFKFASGIAVAPDGTLYVADQGNHRIRRVTPDGIITTVAGTVKGYSGDNGPAVKARLFWPTSLAIGADGSLYFTDLGNYVVRRISTSGIITTVAGMFLQDESREFGGDDGPALKAKFFDPTGLAVGADGSLYIADTGNHRIRHVGPDGIVRTLAGVAQKKEYGDFTGDGSPARLAKLSYPIGLAFGPDGSLYFYDAQFQRGEGKADVRHIRQRVRRISPPMPGFTNTEIAVPSPDGKELYKFNAVGQHLETLDPLTKAVRMRFDYNDDGRLIGIEDAKSVSITIERDENGRPQALVFKDKKIAMDVNADGYLERLTFPGGEEARMSYHPGGLLKEFVSPSVNNKDGKK